MSKKTIHFILLLSLIGCKKVVKDLTPVEAASFYPCQTEEIFWYAVMMSESGGNPKTRYVERGGEVSGGLYQLSVGDAGRYGCDFKSETDLYDPKKNTDCKNRIASKLRAMYPSLGWELVLGKYWGTMRSKAKWPEYHKSYPNHKGYVNLQKYAKERGCIIP